MTRTLLAVMLAGMAWGQAAKDQGSIRGAVRDTSGAPVAGGTVEIRVPNVIDVRASTGSQGEYELRGVPAGTYTVIARMPAVNLSSGGGTNISSGPSASRNVRVNPGQDVTGIDFRIALNSTISGIVTDENGDPVNGLAVQLLKREYQKGQLGWFRGGPTATTNDRGEYKITLLQQAERDYYVLVQPPGTGSGARSDAPDDPALRKTVYVPAYYPNSPIPEGAQALRLRPGENRTGVDLQLRKSPSYCVEATLTAGGAPSPLLWDLAHAAPNNGAGSFIMVTTPKPADGKIRVCDLPPGDYVLTASDAEFLAMNANVHGNVAITIRDKDIKDLVLNAEPAVVIPGRLVWDAEAPAAGPTGDVSVTISALDAAVLSRVQQPVPSEFRIGNVARVPSRVLVFNLPQGAYVKDVTYGGQSVWHSPILPGSMTGTELRVVLARDGATVQARVADDDGEPIQGTGVHIFPASIPSEALFSDYVASGRTDQEGSFTSALLAPGKYLALATDTPLFPSPDSVHRFWLARSRATEIELGPGQSASVTLKKVIVE